MSDPQEMLSLVRAMVVELDADQSLATLAERVGKSSFHVHRAFKRLTGETPKRYTLRLRLEAAAAELVATDRPVAAVGFGAGFTSHEVFTRAFRRHFGRTPTAYRVAGRPFARADRRRHRRVVLATSPCVHLYRMTTESPRRVPVPLVSIERREVASMPVLFIRRRIPRAEMATTIGQCLGKVFGHCQATGVALAGPPFSRYPEVGPGLVTVEIGLPVGSAVQGTGELEAGTLQGGSVAVAVHAGPYDTLAETYTAVEQWISERGLHPAGAPWELYVTDPAQTPNQVDWRTEVYWPIAD